jgi:hypothetical protein
MTTRKTAIIIIAFVCLLSGTGVVMAENKDIVVRAECIKTAMGFALGFRIEVINLSLDKNLMFAVRDNISFLFHIRLINEEGKNISPRLPNIAKYKLATPKQGRHETIAPGASYVWFVPVPHQTRIIRNETTSVDNLHITPAGQYMVEIYVSFGYFMQDKDEKSIPRFPDYKNFILTLPRIPVQIDPSVFGEDIKKVYQETKKDTININ